jgi:hypothetical protein
MAIGGYSINGYLSLIYYWLLVAILLMDIGGYFINGLLVAILLMAIGGYFINGLLVAILLMIIGGYSINGYWWLFY